jgi:hypothetical protein
MPDNAKKRGVGINNSPLKSIGQYLIPPSPLIFAPLKSIGQYLIPPSPLIFTSVTFNF